MSSGYITKKYLLDNLKLFKKNVLDKIYVPITRTVNGKSLSANISLSPSDIGASPTGHTHTKSEIGLGNVDNTADANKSVKYASSAGSASFVAWNNVSGKPSTFTPSSHTHDDRYYTESEINSKLNGKAESIALVPDANLNNITTPGIYSCGGGNSISNKPSGIDAIGLIVVHNATGSFYTQILTNSTNTNTYRRTCNNGTWSTWTQDKYTDTNTWRGIQNNLTSTATVQSLSAYQGKILKDLVDKKTTFTYSSTQPTSPASNAVWVG